MAETEQLFGHEAVEHNAGFSPMPDSAPPSESDGSSDLGSKPSDLREIAEGLSEQRETPAGLDTVEYKKTDEHGRRTQEREDPKKSIKLERGAKDLAAWRQSEVEAREREQADLVRSHADALRAGQQSPIDAQQQQPQWSPEQQQAQAALQTAYNQSPSHGYDAQIIAGARDPQVRANVQFTQQQISQQMQVLDEQIGTAYSLGQDTGTLGQQYQQLLQAKEQVDFVDRTQALIGAGLSPRAAAGLADREVLSHVMDFCNQFENHYREDARQQEAMAKDILNATTRVFLDAIPELQGVTNQGQIDAIFKTIARQNPARSDYIANQIHNFNRALAFGMESTKRAEQQRAEGFNTWAERQDFAFRQSQREFFSPETQRAVAFEAFEMLEAEGLSREDVISLHDGKATATASELFRSKVGQSIFWKALQWERHQKAKAGISAKRQGPAPVHTLKPGSSETHIDRDRSERLPETISGAKDAAQILMNRRARARR